MENYRFIGKDPLRLTAVQGVQRNIHANICTQLLNLLYEQRKYAGYKAAQQIVLNAQKAGMGSQDIKAIWELADDNGWVDVIVLLDYVTQGVKTIRKFEGSWQDCIDEDEEISDPSEADF